MAHALGLKEEWKLSEMYGLDEESLKMVATPVEALIFLYPDAGEIQPDSKNVMNDSSHFFIEQIATLGNACGTIALMHRLIHFPKVDLLSLLKLLSTKKMKVSMQF